MTLAGNGYSRFVKWNGLEVCACVCVFLVFFCAIKSQIHTDGVRIVRFVVAVVYVYVCCSLACLIHQQQHRLHWGFLLFLFIPRRLMIFRFINIFAFNCVLHCSHSFALSLFLWPCLCLFLARFVCTSCDSKVFIKWKINRGNLVGCGAARRPLATTAITINVGKFSAPFHSNKRDLAANSRRVKSEWEKNALFNMKCN